MDSDALRRDVLLGFDYAHNLEDWSNPVEDALDGVTAQEALWRAGPESMGIWDIVLHMAVWTENALERIQTGEHTHPAEGAWPAPPDTADEHAWEESKQRLRNALAAMKAKIEEMPSTSFLENNIVSWSPLLELLGRFIHNAYHLGQITKIREILDAGVLEPTK